MATFFWITILFICLVVAIKALGESSIYLRRCYFIGVNLWAQWLPILASGAYVFLVGSSISDQAALIKSPDMLLSGYLNVAELIVLFVLTPLFFTKAGNLTGAAITVYIVERLYFSSSGLTVNTGILILLSCSTTVAILSDKMPWFHKHSRSQTATSWREILLILLALFAIFIMFATILDIRQFAYWLSHYYGVSLAPTVAFGGTAILIVGWVSVILGMTRHFSLPVLCLPSILMTAYITHWPSFVLVIPFAASLALTLAVADRRYLV